MELAELVVKLRADLGDVAPQLASVSDGLADVGTAAKKTADSLGSDLEEQLKALQAHGMTLAESLAAVGNSFTGTGDSSAAAADQLSLFDEAAGVSYADAAGQLNLFATELEPIAGAAETAADALAGMGAAGSEAKPPLEDYNQEVEKTKQVHEEAASSSRELLESLLEFAGIAVTVEALKELVTESINLWAAEERATIAIGFLTGNAEEAAETVEHLHSVSLQLAVSADSLIGVFQMLTAAGAGAEAINGVLYAAADAAAATGKSFEQASGSIQRMVIGGMAGGRQLINLGLTATDLANVMQVSTDKVSAAFKSLTVEERMAVVSAALEKFEGAGEKLASSTSGQLTNIKTAWEISMQELGKSIAPVVGTVLPLLATGIKSVVSVAAGLWTALEVVAVGIIGLATIVQTFVLTTGNALLSFASGKFKEAVEIIKGGAGDVKREFQDMANATQKQIGDTGEFLKGFWKTASPADGRPEKDADALAKAIKHAGETAAEAADKFKSLPFAQKSLEAAIWVAEMQEAESKLSSFIKEVAKFEGVAGYLKHFSDSLKQTDSDMERMNTEAAKKHLDELGQAVLSNIFSLKGVKPPLDEYQKALVGLGLDAAGTGESLKNLGKDFATVMTGAKDVAVVDAAWTKMAQTISRMAKTDLPGAVAAYDEYIEALKRVQAPMGEIYAAQQKQLEMEIALKEQRGEATNSQIVALTNLELRQKQLQLSTGNLGKTYQELAMGVVHAFDQMGASIARGIVQGKNFGKIMLDVLKQIAETILTTLINAIVRLVESWILTALLGKAKASAIAVANVVGQSAVAGAAGFASVMAAVPFPFNVALAPAVAAAATAAVQATYVPIATFEYGGEVPKDMIATVHAGETFLTEDLTKLLKQVLYGPQGSASPSGAGDGSVVFQNCSFSGVTQDLVDNVMNRAIKGARRVNAKL